MSKLPITAIVPVQSFGASLFNAAGRALEDGQVTPLDAAYLGPVAFKLPTLLKVQWGQLLPQFADLDDAEKAELKKAFSEEFDISDDELEAHFEELYGAILALALALSQGVAAVGKIRAKLAKGVSPSV
jgi:hypothetical protein